MRPRSLLATITALAVTAAACSNGDDDTTNTTETSAAATTTSTTPATTTAASTTTIAGAVTTTSDATATTAEATTSTSEPVDEVQEVIDQFAAAWRAFNDVKLDPSSKVKLEAARSRFTGEALSALEERVESFRRDNLRGQTNPAAPARAEVYRETVVVERDSATFAVCDINSNRLVEIGAAPDGSDAIVNEDIVARLVETTMTRTEAGWLLARGVTTAEYFGQDSCEDP